MLKIKYDASQLNTKRDRARKRVRARQMLGVEEREREREGQRNTVLPDCAMCEKRRAKFVHALPVITVVEAQPGCEEVGAVVRGGEWVRASNMCNSRLHASHAYSVVRGTPSSAAAVVAALLHTNL